MEELNQPLAETNNEEDFADHFIKTYHDADKNFQKELRVMLREWCIEVDGFVKTPKLKNAIRTLYKNLLEIDRDLANEVKRNIPQVELLAPDEKADMPPV